VLGYLVQRSIGYGLRWQGTVEESGALPPHGFVPKDGAGGWSPAAATALDRALARALCRGARAASGVDLLAALAGDPSCRAVEVLAHAGVDAGELSGRLVPGPQHGDSGPSRLRLCDSSNDDEAPDAP
jgi:hypothetical protein